MGPASQRLHALDGLRAAMMLLGLVLHSAISYGTYPYGSAWPYKDAATNMVLDVLVMFVHVFRMPIFFLLAGFFAAMLYLRRGAAGLARNRATRIAVPFVAGWAVLYPLVAGGFTFANAAQRAGLAAGLAEVRAGLAGGSLLPGNNTMHLWFLYDLIVYYLAALAIAPLARRLPRRVRAAALGGFAAVVRRPLWRPLPLAVLTAITLWPMNGILLTSVTFVPDLAPLVAYGVFFAFGWVLYLRRELLPSFDRWAATQVAVALALLPVNNWGLTRLEAGGPLALPVTALSGGLIVWLLTFGITGLFLRWLDRPSPGVRYVVDASYWLYLVHLPFAIWVPGWLSGAGWPALAKFAVTLAATGLAGFASYDLLVRTTFVGLVLNGRRYPRGLVPGVC